MSWFTDALPGGSEQASAEDLKRAIEEAARMQAAAQAAAAQQQQSQAESEQWGRDVDAQQRQTTPYAPFGAYLPGDLSHMMASWMPGQTASPVLPNNPYAPWAGTDWANRFAAEDRRGQWGTPEAAPEGLGSQMRDQAQQEAAAAAYGPRGGGTSMLGASHAGGASRKQPGGMLAGIAGPATGAAPLNPLALAEWLAAGTGKNTKGR